jgi:hypothetical protein
LRIEGSADAGQRGGRDISKHPEALRAGGSIGVRLPAGFRASAVAAAAVALLGALGVAATTLKPPAQTPSTAIAPSTTPQAAEAYRKQPLSFIPNRGQSDHRVRYYAQAGGAHFYFTKRKVVVSLVNGKRGLALDLTPLGASRNAKLEASRPLPGKVNYLIGSERHANLPTYREIAYRELWPGVDLVFKGRGGKLEYELRLEPGADPSKIRLAYRGAEGLSIGAAGDLSIQTAAGTLRDARPRSYQRIGGRRVPIRSRYVLEEGGGSAFGFRLGRSYDPRRPLVIDPVLYSTFLGGSDLEKGVAIAVDGSGSAYLLSQTDSTDFPTTAGAFDTTSNGLHDVSVTKLNATGSGLVYSTYLGGAADDVPAGIAVDGSGNAYLTGHTASSTFPTTSGAFDTTLGGTDDVFVTKLNASGAAPVYSTYVGGSGFDGGLGIALDASGNAYLAGNSNSSDFPTTSGAFQASLGGSYDAVVTKLNARGSGLAYSTYLGGSKDEEGRAIALDGSGNAYVAGRTDSSNLPTTSGAFDTSSNGSLDMFVTKLNASGSSAAYSTYLGGGGNDRGRGIAVDGSGSAYVTAFVSSSDFPTTSGAFDTSYNGNRDATVTKLNAGGSGLVYSAYLGGTGEDQGNAITVDGSGSAYVVGNTASSDFPTTAGEDTTYNGGLADGFVTKVDASGSSLASAAFLGGAGEDEADGVVVNTGGNVYVAGYTLSSDFPITAGAFDTTLGGTRDAFVQVTTATAPGYPRPKGATPLRASLAVAYKPCTSPNRTHGAPLSSPSCNPPAPQSSWLTVGTPDANGRGASSVASLSLATVVGDPLTGADEADVTLLASLTDVRKKSDLSDYTGELQAKLTLKITDKYNGASLTDAATGVQTPFTFRIPCSATTDTSIGSTCAVNTTADSVTPGAVLESKRAIWELGKVEVFDGGGDGVASTTSDNTLFMDQAVFVP